MKLSVVIPAYNDQENIEETIKNLYRKLNAEKIEHELLVIHDECPNDKSGEIAISLLPKIPTLHYIKKSPPRGFGLALRKGLEFFSGDAVAFYMADGSDSPGDLVSYFRTMEKENVDCVFGSRFIPGGKMINYPRVKYIFNRLGNHFIKILFGLQYNDFTNAFKLYHRRVIEKTQPFAGQHFNFTVELVLKSLTGGHTFRVVPNSWKGRSASESNFNIKKMVFLNLLTIFNCLIKKHFFKND
ncbi:MAG: glycosyltransferase family 2 protein [Patescibacteria group bacterium]